MWVNVILKPSVHNCQTERIHLIFPLLRRERVNRLQPRVGDPFGSSYRNDVRNPATQLFLPSIEPL